MRYYGYDAVNNVKWYIMDFTPEKLEKMEAEGVEFYREDGSTATKVKASEIEKPVGHTCKKLIDIATPKYVENQLKPITDMISLLVSILTEFSPLHKAELQKAIKAIKDKELKA